VALGSFTLESAIESSPDLTPDVPLDPGAYEAAVVLAALAGLDAASGYFLLGPGLEFEASELAVIAPALEVVSAVSAAHPAMLVEDFPLPFLDGRFAAAAVKTDAPIAMAEVARIVRPGGRVVVLGSLTVDNTEPGGSLRLMAADERASVYVREVGP